MYTQYEVLHPWILHRIHFVPERLDRRRMRVSGTAQGGVGAEPDAESPV